MSAPASPAAGAGGRGDVGLRPAAGLGLGLVLGASLLLTLNDTLAKLAIGEMPLSQFILMRGLVVLTGLTLILVATRRLHVLKVRNRRGMALRCACMAASTYLFLSGLQRMPMADAFSIAFASPIIALALAALILKEKVGWRRWAAVLAGFTGVMLAMLPSGQGYLWTVALFPLGSACCAALRDIVSRRLSATDASLGILFYAVLAVTLSGLIGGIGESWTMPRLELVWLMLGSAALQSVANFLHIEAFRYAEVSFLTPFRYVALVFATLMGFLVWGDLPTWNVAFGSLVIVGSGLFIWHRERQLARRAAISRAAENAAGTPSTPGSGAI